MCQGQILLGAMYPEDFFLWVHLHCALSAQGTSTHMVEANLFQYGLIARSAFIVNEVAVS